MTIKEAVETFRSKYNFKEIWAVNSDDEYSVINVFTTNAKIWVDIPAKHEGYVVKMNVARKTRSAEAP